MSQSAKKVVRLKTERELERETREIERALDANPRVRQMRVVERLKDVAREVSVIYWACAGLREAISDGDELGGIERLAHRIQGELEAIAEEVGS